MSLLNINYYALRELFTKTGAFRRFVVNLLQTLTTKWVAKGAIKVILWAKIVMAHGSTRL